MVRSASKSSTCCKRPDRCPVVLPKDSSYLMICYSVIIALIALHSLRRLLGSTPIILKYACGMRGTWRMKLTPMLKHLQFLNLFFHAYHRRSGHWTVPSGRHLN